MSIVYRKDSVNEADVVSRRLYFFHPDDVHLRKLVEMFALWLDGNVPDWCYQDNDTALLVLLANIVSVDDEFLTKLKTTYSSCSYLSNRKSRWKGHELIKSSNGLYTYHDMLVIHPPEKDLRILLLNGYHDDVGHPNWHRLLATLLKRCWWERMSFVCKARCSNCVVYNQDNPSRQGSSYSSSLGVPNDPWEITGMVFIADLSNSFKFNFTAILSLVCHSTKMARFVPFHKETKAE